MVILGQYRERAIVSLHAAEASPESSQPSGSEAHKFLCPVTVGGPIQLH